MPTCHAQAVERGVPALPQRYGPITAAASAAAIAAFAVGPGAAADAAAPRQTVSYAFTSSTPGAVTGNVLSVEFRNPADASLKPYAAARMVVHIPRGTVTDTTVPPQCHATDAEIYVAGPAACPPETRIGSGFAVSDGGGSESSRYSQTTITHFNNQDEIVGIGVVDDIPAIKTIDRTEIEGGTSTSDFPLFPGVPPPEPYTPVKRLFIYFPPYTRGGRAYTRTPPTCPRAGYWTFTVDFTYRDGVTESTESRSPCLRRPSGQSNHPHRKRAKKRHRRHRRHR